MTAEKPRRPGGLIVAAATYLVAARLSLMGYNVAVTSRNAAGTDVLVENPANRKTLSIQVKSRELPKKNRFIIQSNPKPLERSPPDRIWVFVRVGTDEKSMDPRFFVLTGTEVNEKARKPSPGS